MKTTKLFKKLPLLACALLVLGMNAPAQSFLTNGLLAYYPFSGNANDATGNGHNGVVRGAILTTDRFGQANSAYAFNGSNSLIIVSNSYDLQPLGDFSISVWAEAPAIPDHFTFMLDKHFGGANNSGWTLNLYPPSVGLPLQFQAAPLFDPFSPQANVPIGTWFQAVFTYQRSSGACNLYVNGVLADSRVRNYNNNNDPDPFVIGALPDPSGFSGYFTGLLDDIRIYNRALSSNEVQQLYAVETGSYAIPQVDVQRAIRLTFSQLTVGLIYQLQFSHNRREWTNVGAPFTATATTQTEYLDTRDLKAQDKFWRLQVAP